MSDGGALAPEGAAELAAELFGENRKALIDNHDFSIFGRLAIDFLCADPEGKTPARRPGSEELYAWVLDLLLQRVVRKLGSDQAEAAARAIDTYVADVVPRLMAAEQKVGALVDLATRAQVTRLLDGETLRVLVDIPTATASAPTEPAARKRTPEFPLLAPPPKKAETEAVEELDPVPAAAAEPPSPPSAAEPPPPIIPIAEPPSPSEPPKDDDWKTAASYDDIRAQCIRAKQMGQPVVAVMGLAATGKSFLIKRLRESLKKTYTFAGTQGMPELGVEPIGRTKDILQSKFRRVGKKESRDDFVIYDMPGDLFAKLVRDGFVVAEADRNKLRLIYAICAFADAIIFVAPALEVLRSATYLEEGDPLGRTYEDRKARLKDIKSFTQSLYELTKVIGLLRTRTARHLKAQRKKSRTTEAYSLAADQAIDEILTLDYAALQIQKRREGVVNMPALLLLSQADVLRNGLSGQVQDEFDFDPAQQLMMRNQELFHHLASQFGGFAVDFVTAEAGHVPNTPFDPERPGFGCDDLVNNWLLPAVRSAKRNPFSRLLERPAVALALRRRLDPPFRKAWDAPVSLQA